MNAFYVLKMLFSLIYNSVYSLSVVLCSYPSCKNSLLFGTVISTSVRSLTGSFVKSVCIAMTFILLVPGKLEFYIPV